MRLVDFPYVVVRVGCTQCHRKGAYRLARLAVAFGPEASTEDVLDRLASNCPWRRPQGLRRPGKYDARCFAEFIDLRDRTPPDLPPSGGLRVIEGGRRDDAA